MGKIIKKNGQIWLEEIQSVNGNHKRIIFLGNYDENEEKVEEQPKTKKVYKKKKSD